jgi:hypothetical protein
MRQSPIHSGLIQVILFASLFAATTLPGLAAPAAMQSSPTLPTTQLTDTVYRADGTTAAGTVLISWPAFTTATGLSVPAGNTSVTIASGGLLTVSLAPNAGSNPMGSYYTAIYHLDDGTVTREYWVVPVSTSPVTISSIKSTVLPATVALQTVTKSYVDTAIANAVTGGGTTTYVPVAGGTMTGPLLLPADPVSSLQAADKHYVDTSVASVGGGSGGKVALLPSASQTITQPTGTALSVNRLNGVEYASQYATGTGANGIANATSSSDCAAGCEVKADTSYTATEPLHPLQWNSQTHVEDTRLGGRWDSYLNPENQQTPGTESGQAIDVVSTRSGAALFQINGARQPASIGLALTNEAPTGGSNLFPQSIDGVVPYFKSGYSALAVAGTYNTQGQHVLAPHGIHCYGVGDCLIGSQYITSSGGFRDEADEGTHPMDLQISEDTAVFDGTCASGCTTGSTAVTITPTAGSGTQGDGRFLIDTTPAKVLSTGSLIGGASGTPHATANFSGTSFPLSTFFATGQAVPSQSNNVAPGTVTFLIATAAAPSGYATNTAAAPATTGLACIADEPSGYLPSNYEVAPFTVVDSTHLQVTFKKAHAALASVAIGGLCGYGLEQTVDTSNGIRQVFPVVGSFSATGLYYAGTTAAIVGQQGTTSAFVNVNAGIATLSRSGNLVTLTTTSALPFDLNGLTVTISGAADSSYNGSFPATTTSSTTLTYSQTGANSSTTGGSLTLLTGGFALYPMAEVLSVYDPAARSVDGLMTLAPNNVAWAAGDTVEEPHFFQQIVDADTSFVSQTAPRPTTYARAGITYQGNNGPGLQGWTITNSTPAANYVGNGGTHTVPDLAYQAIGPWKRTFVLQAGDQSAFTINCNSHGCGKWNSPYNLFELQSSAGTDVIQWQPGTSTLAFTLRGAQYSLSPSAFTAGTVNATTLNATTLNGALSAANLTGTLAAARLPLFGASGTTHATGAVPDPGATAGATRYLREDGTWDVPPGGGSGGSGSVTSVAAGSWPAWLTPTVSNATTTPSIAVAASPIPNSALANATVTVNGTACALGASCTAFSYATLPQQSNILADYQLLDGSGTAPIDSSGNGNTGSFPSGAAAPTWTSQGISCNGGYPSSPTGQYFTTAGTQNAKSIMMVYTTNPPLGNNGASYPTYYTLFQNAAITGLGLYAPSQNYGYLPQMTVSGSPYSIMAGSIVGTHVLIVVLGVAGVGTGLDQYYLDGVPQNYGTTGGTSTFGTSTGVFDVCGAPTGYSTYMYGNVYRATFWSTQLSAQDAAAASGLSKTLAQSRGVNFGTVSTNPGTTANQLVCTGDSLTNGEGVTPFCTASLLTTRLTYNVLNYGIGNIGANVNASLLPFREQLAYAPNAASNISFIWNGTNDITTKGFTAQQALNSIIEECNLNKKFGFKTIVATPIARANSGTSEDAVDKDVLGPLLRQYAVPGGCDALADFAGNPIVGADGAYTNTTYYQSDQTHLTATGQASIIAPMASRAIDQLTGSTITNCDPIVVTTAAYTSVASDGCKVFNTAANSITDTLPSAIGYTGRVIRRCNTSASGSNTLTIAAPSDTPFNNIAGTTAITVPNNSCKDFKSTLVSTTAAGEYWQQLN